MDGEEYEISDTEVHELKVDADLDTAAVTPKCYLPIWIPVESPAERIQRAKEQVSAVAVAAGKVEVDTSGKDTDSNGKEVGSAASRMFSGVAEETGLTPSLKKMNLAGHAANEESDGSPKPMRQRKKSKSLGNEKSGEEEEKCGGAAEKTPGSPEKESKSPKMGNKEEEAALGKNLEECASIEVKSTT